MHNFKYVLKTLFRKRMLIFWTYLFPIVLGLLFNFAFADLENGEKLNLIDIAVVNNEKFNNSNYYKTAFSSLSDDKSDKQLFNTKYVSLEDAKKLLEDREITSYILIEDDINVVINSNGFNETIVKSVCDEIMEKEAIISNIVDYKINEELKNNVDINSVIDTIYSDSIKMMNDSSANIKNIANGNLGFTMVEFYTLIAMACLYGGILGVTALNQTLPNMSSKGKRVSISPISKFKLVISSLCASYITQLLGVFLLFIFTIFVLNVDYGSNLGLIILLAIVGSLAGLSLGIFVGSVFKTNENSKTGIIIAITMFGCFLSGMMGITTKYVVDKNIPILNKINPANMITDGFYSLYYYDTLNRYWFNLVSLLIFSIILIGISMANLRRQKYDSI